MHQPYLWGPLSLGNPSSRHTLGQAQAEAIEAAREQVRAAVSSSSSDAIVFTSGATEANALAIRALALAGRERGLVDRRHVLISATEHPSAMLSATALRRDGFDVTIFEAASQLGGNAKTFLW